MAIISPKQKKASKFIKYMPFKLNKAEIGKSRAAIGI